MPCPSDFRSGDNADSRSPHFDEPPGDNVIAPYVLTDTKGVDHKVEIEIEFYLRTDRNDSVNVEEPSITDIRKAGSGKLMAIESAKKLGTLPDESELAGLVYDVMSWRKSAFIDLGLKNPAGEPVDAKLRVSYYAYPKDDPIHDGDVDVRYQEIGKVVKTDKLNFEPLDKFRIKYPDLKIPSGEELVVKIHEAHAENYLLKNPLIAEKLLNGDDVPVKKDKKIRP